MTKPPLVAVSQRIDLWEQRGERRDALDQKFLHFIASAGGLAVPVPNAFPNGANDLRAWLQAIRPDAVLLSGGNDIGQCADRDATERLLLDFAQSRKLPLLGLCRGMQMLADWAGVGLVPVEGHIRSRHDLRILDKNGPWPKTVNSFHALSLDQCPKSFKVAAMVADGTIEAICHDTLPWEGWMWHPEREADLDAAEIARFSALLTSGTNK